MDRFILIVTRISQACGIIAAGLADAGIGREQVEVVLTEQEAVASAIARLGDQDLVVVLVDDVPAVLDQLRSLRTQL